MTQVGLAPRSSAQRRMSSWSVVVCALDDDEREDAEREEDEDDDFDRPLDDRPPDARPPFAAARDRPPPEDLPLDRLEDALPEDFVFVAALGSPRTCEVDWGQPIPASAFASVHLSIPRSSQLSTGSPPLGC